MRENRKIHGERERGKKKEKWEVGEGEWGAGLKRREK